MIKSFKEIFILFLICCVFNNSVYGFPKNIISREEQSTIAPTSEIKLEEKPIAGILKKCDSCPSNIKCVPQIQCPAHVRMQPHERPQICDLPAGKPGLCCLTGRNHTVVPKKDERTVAHFHKMKLSIIEEARAKFAAMLHHASHRVQKGQPEFLHNIVFHSTPHDVVKTFQLSNSAMEQVFATQIYKEKENIATEDFETNRVDVDFHSSPLGQHCAAAPFCRNLEARYRSADGTCNNPLPHRSLWGSAGQPMERLLPPAYEDGIWLPRIHSIDGSLLPGARKISRLLLPDVDRPHPRCNLLVMQFGQFIAHDITQSSSITLDNGEAIQCCSNDGSHILPEHLSHFACMAIPIEPEDEFYQTFNQGCLNFVRLSLAPHSDCKVGYGKQLSKVTHYLDGSPIYGSDQVKQNELREFRGGRLRMFHDFGRDLLPLSTDRGSCQSSEAVGACFQSGDGRTNQIVSLVVLHTIFAREHNRIADALAELNPHHSDEVLFQEARRIVIAELQHIIFNEWLPLVIGSSTMKRFGLNPKHHGYASDYDPEVNPAITNEFSGAAFRFGHSTVSGKYHLHRNNDIDEVIDIPDVMFNPSRIRKRTFLDNLIRGLTEQPMQKVDDSISEGLSKYLFRGDNPFGLDLAALNIQRGRDEGLRSYNDYLQVMGHHRIKSFKEFGSKIGQKLSEVYRHPDDIDLWIGGLLESATADAIVGPTFGEIIADQFSRFRRGDRYFYEYGPKINPGYFTHDQLGEIRKASMARIICDNIDHYTLRDLPPAAFLRSDMHRNHPIRCESMAIPFINLEAWKE